MKDAPKEPKPKLEDVCTPIFDPAMGRRMASMRRQMDMRQAELGQRLGVTQSVISEMETGKCSIPRQPFTVSALKEAFGARAGYILHGQNPERFFLTPSAMANYRTAEKLNAEYDSKQLKMKQEKNK